jgi:FtsH-binding integral membrane protein
MSVPDQRFRSPQQLAEIRHNVYQGLLGLVVFMIAAFGVVVYYSYFIVERGAFDSVLKLLVITFGLPTYLLLAATERIPKEISGAVIMTLIGFCSRQGVVRAGAGSRDGGVTITSGSAAAF